MNTITNTSYKVVMYRHCILGVNNINASSPQKALEMFKTALTFAPSLEEASSFIEVDEDFPPTEISVYEEENYTKVLTIKTESIENLVNLPSVPQTESDYSNLVSIRTLLTLHQNNDKGKDTRPLFNLITNLLNLYRR